jgi:hypothetical protein
LSSLKAQNFDIALEDLKNFLFDLIRSYTMILFKPMEAKMESEYDKFRTELALTLIDVGASNIQFTKESWLVNFQIKGRKFYCFFDEGIDCHREFGEPFFSPLDWNKKLLNKLRYKLENDSVDNID